MPANFSNLDVEPPLLFASCPKDGFYIASFFFAMGFLPLICLMGFALNAFSSPMGPSSSSLPPRSSINSALTDLTRISLPSQPHSEDSLSRSNSKIPFASYPSDGDLQPQLSGLDVRHWLGNPNNSIIKSFEKDFLDQVRKNSFHHTFSSPTFC